RQRGRGHQQREKWREKGAGEEEEDDEGRGGEKRDREGEVRGDGAPLVFEGGRIPADEERICALERAQLADESLRCRAVGWLGCDQVDLPGVPAEKARRRDGEDALEMARLVRKRGGRCRGPQRRLHGEVEGGAAVWHELAR